MTHSNIFLSVREKRNGFLIQSKVLMKIEITESPLDVANEEALDLANTNGGGYTSDDIQFAVSGSREEFGEWLEL